MEKRKNDHDLDCKKCNNGKVTVTSKLMKDHVSTNVSKCSNCKYQYGLNEILKANRINMFGDPKLLSHGVETIPEERGCPFDEVAFNPDTPIPVEGEGVKRKVGTYWIKLHTGWTAAHFNGECFWYGNSPILAQKVYDIIESRIPSPDDEQGVSFPNKLHSDTEQLLKNTSNILREKLIKNQKKYGYSNEWILDDWEDECRQQMMQHIQKGDPKDVIIYAMFMLFHGWSTVFSPPSANDGREGRDEERELAEEIISQSECYVLKDQTDSELGFGTFYKISEDELVRAMIRFKNLSLPTERSKAEQWISVEERLPESMNTVIIFTNVSLMPTLGYYINKDWLYFSHSENFWLSKQPHIKVLHWQPLPQPPLNNDKII